MKNSTCTPPIPSDDFTGEVSASILEEPLTRHDFGNVTVVKDRDGVYKSFSSPVSTSFVVKENISDGNFFSATTSQKRVSFLGIPSPGFTCGNGRHAFGCPFRTGGRGYVRIENGTALIMSVIVYWNGTHANPGKNLKQFSTSVVAFRSSDNGYTWEYISTILDASAFPDSEEGIVQ